MTTPLTCEAIFAAAEIVEPLLLADHSGREGRMAQDQDNNRQRHVSAPDIEEEA